MHKHTLGRWEARELFADDEPQSLGLFVYAEHEALDEPLAVASLPGISPLDFANAQLIAAAPELLAACEAALLREDIAADELGDQLRAALAKARGANASGR